MTAGDLFDGYRYGSFDPEGKASANSCRQVLRELCRVAHDAGIAQIGTERLAERLGLSRHTVMRALKRLKTDGVISQPVRGTGNRQGSEPRQSVWVIRPLPDRNGRTLPDPARVKAALVKYQQSTRWLSLSESLRLEVLQAWHDLNMPGLVTVTPPAGVSPVGKPDDLIADFKARKARERLRVVPDKGVQLSSSQTQLSSSTAPHYTSVTKKDPRDVDRQTQLDALKKMIENEAAKHCPTWRQLTATEAG
jgi:biotin operon repressor